MATARPGVALRQLRKANDWTLADVSKRTGVPASTLSRIENDQISPTYDLLLRLSAGLSIDLTQFLSIEDSAREPGADHAGRRSVSRRGEGLVVSEPSHKLTYLSTDLVQKQMTPMLTEYHARSLAEFGEFMRHAGEEFLYVLEGELELHTESYTPLILKAGEATYFDSRMGHAYVARGEGPCRGLVICTVPRADERGMPSSEKQLSPTPPGSEVVHFPKTRIVKSSKQRARKAR
jgi:transcriptional regulator with XRE-family HTH domain